jgi:ABC-type lipoprotein export system ATPase subunit
MPDNYEAFVTAYNNFDSQPLRGEKLRRFYVDDFTKDAVNEITTTIRITERFKKMLVIGHRGCGKSTILNKVAEDLRDKYHVVAFSAADVINMMDVEVVDILLGTYLQVLESVDLKKDSKFSERLLKPFQNLMKFFSNIEKMNILEFISVKFKVETESRDAIRQALRHQMDTLQKNLSNACDEIHKATKKNVLVIIDDLDKLDTQFAERIFYANSDLLTLPKAKIVYTFPLDTYYCSDFIRIRDQYADQFISLVNVRNFEGDSLETSQHALIKLILRRIDEGLITEEAMRYLIDMSGGLLRDLVKFMQDACKLAIVEKSAKIEQNTVESAINAHINDYRRVFDFPNYAEKVQHIAKTKKMIDNKTLVYLLRYLFVLEYRQGDKLWYDVHPCLNKALGKKEQGEIMQDKFVLEKQIEKAQRNLQTHHLSISYSELASMYESQELTIAPEYQRHFHWMDTQKTRFIESILLGFPTAAIFVVQNAQGLWELVDGMQRLATVFEFIGVLKNIDGQHLPPFRLAFASNQTTQLSLLEGLTFAELSTRTSSSIQHAICRVEIIKIDNNQSLKYEVFARLNPGIQYNPQ